MMVELPNGRRMDLSAPWAPFVCGPYLLGYCVFLAAFLVLASADRLLSKIGAV